MNYANGLKVANLGVLFIAMAIAAGAILGLAGCKSEPVQNLRFVLVSDREDAAAIYAQNEDGSDGQRISDPSLGFCLYPSNSPDGQRVAYWATEEPAFREDGIKAALWVSALDGSQHTRVTGDFPSAPIILPPAWSPDGLRLAFVAPNGTASGANSGFAVSIVRADGSGLEREIPLPWETQAIKWSPAGDNLLLVSLTMNNGKVYVWFNDSGELTEVARGEAAAWSPDGTEIIVADTNARSLRIVGLGGTTRTVLELAQGFPLTVAWSPDGETVAFGTADSLTRGRSFSVYFSTSLYMLTLKSGDVETVMENNGRIHHLVWSDDSKRLLFTLVNSGARSGSDVPYANLWEVRTSNSRLSQLTQEKGFAGFGTWIP